MRTIEARDLPQRMDRFEALSYKHDGVMGIGTVVIANCIVKTSDLARLNPTTQRLDFEAATNSALAWGQSRVIVTYDPNEAAYMTSITARTEDETAQSLLYEIAEGYTSVDGQEADTGNERRDANRIVTIDGKRFLDMSPGLLAAQVEAGELPNYDFPSRSIAEIKKFGQEIGIIVHELTQSGYQEVDLSSGTGVQDQAILHKALRLQQLHSNVLKHILGSSIPRDTLSSKASRRKELQQKAGDAEQPKSTRYWAMKALDMSEQEIAEALGEDFVLVMKRGIPPERIPKKTKKRKKFMKEKAKERKRNHKASVKAAKRQIERQREEQERREVSVRKYYEDHPEKKPSDQQKPIRKLPLITPLTEGSKQSLGEEKMLADPALASDIDVFELLLDTNGPIVSSYFSVLQARLDESDVNPESIELRSPVNFDVSKDATEGLLYSLYRRSVGSRSGDDEVIRYEATLLRGSGPDAVRTHALITKKGSALQIKVTELDQQGNPSKQTDPREIKVHLHLLRNAFASDLPERKVKKLAKMREKYKKLLRSAETPAERAKIQQRIDATKL